MRSIDKINAIFGSNGTLSTTLPSFELRSGQIEMAKAILSTLGLISGNSEIHPPNKSQFPAKLAAIEAETGIGKTMAYLVPAVLSGQKVVVSTGTITLQDQILNKEIPFLKKHLFPELKALCMKGRENYLCLYRAKQLLSTPQLSLFAEDQEVNLLQEWLGQTESGDRAEISWLPDNSGLWRQISSTTRKCLGNSCPEWQSCFVNRLRRKAAKAQILVVNHHLFFSDLGLRRFGHAEVLPRYESVIFDEAHHLEGIATRYFGTSFSHYQVIDLVKDVENLAIEKDQKKSAKTIQIARALRSEAEIFAASFPKETGRFPLTDLIGQIPGWPDILRALFEAIDALTNHIAPLSLTNETWKGLVQRGQEIKTSLETITMHQEPTSVYWGERHHKTVALTASPIEIAPELQEHLYGQNRAIVFTSATLTTGGNFRYFKERMGLDDQCATMTLASPFDYSARTRLYVPPISFPEPNAPDFQGRVQERVMEILLGTKGRALVLFTSVRAMKNMEFFLRDRLPYPLLVQGDSPKHLLLSEFQQNNHSVLLAVASFWEGVNVPGETLSCVIIDKLPFEVPSDPVIMARINKVRQEGGNPFFDFQVPRAILTLRQGLGRLMRSASDRGIMAIMDIRVFTKGYGKTVRASLPDSPIIRETADVEIFIGDE